MSEYPKGTQLYCATCNRAQFENADTYLLIIEHVVTDGHHINRRVCVCRSCAQSLVDVIDGAAIVSHASPGITP